MSTSEEIMTGEEGYILAVGESVNLDIEPKKQDYSITTEDDIVKTSNAGEIKGLKAGKTIVTIRRANSEKSVVINVYDRVVDAKDKCTHPRHYQSLALALAYSNDNDIICVRTGKYNESVKIEQDICIVGEDNVVMHSMEIGKDRRVAIENIGFVSRDYLGEGNATIKAGEGACLTVKKCSFFVDKKSDAKEDRKDGYAIYVRPNSLLIDIHACTFQGYKVAISIESTDARIGIHDSKFDAINKGIVLDIRDGELDNRHATGSIGDNTFYDVVEEVDFRYNGPLYEGDLIIEKHDKL